MKKRCSLLLIGFFVIFLTSDVKGDLIVKATGGVVTGGSGNYQLIYDTELDITWLDYTSPRDTLANQKTWAGNLEISFDGRIFDNWRLPQTLPVDGLSYDYSYSYDGSTDYGFNISNVGSAYPGSKGSEMAYLYYSSLGNNGGYTVAGLKLCDEYCLRNKGPFKRLLNVLEFYCWSETDYDNASNKVWIFSFREGFQGGVNKGGDRYALAVHPGDISTPIPEPTTMLLLGAGLIGLAGIGRKKLFNKV